MKSGDRTKYIGDDARIVKDASRPLNRQTINAWILVACDMRLARDPGPTQDRWGGGGTDIVPWARVDPTLPYRGTVLIGGYHNYL